MLPGQQEKGQLELSCLGLLMSTHTFSCLSLWLVTLVGFNETRLLQDTFIKNLCFHTSWDFPLALRNLWNDSYLWAFREHFIELT